MNLTIIMSTTTILFFFARHSGNLSLSFHRIYRVIQIELMMHWTKIVFFMMIVNLFLYNPALCTIPLENVSEEAERLGVWELIHRRINDQDIGVWLEDKPHRVTPESAIDGNQTCEDAAYNEREPLPKSAEADDSTMILPEEEINEKLAHLTLIEDRAIQILNVSYPAVLDPNLPPVDIPDTSMKIAVFTAIMESGNPSKWVPKTEVEALDPDSEPMKYITLLKTIVDNNTECSELQKALLRHMGTYISTISGFVYLETDITLSTLSHTHISDEYYEEVYNNIWT